MGEHRKVPDEWEPWHPKAKNPEDQARLDAMVERLAAEVWNERKEGKNMGTNQGRALMYSEDGRMRTLLFVHGRTQGGGGVVVSKRLEGRVSVHGAARVLEVRCGDWRIRAEQARSLIGSPDTFDVFAEHCSGTRVPPGPNMHREPGSEMARLEGVVAWPRKEPWGHSWLP